MYINFNGTIILISSPNLVYYIFICDTQIIAGDLQRTKFIHASV